MLINYIIEHRQSQKLRNHENNVIKTASKIALSTLKKGK
jgi:hypothetical protein